MWRVRCLSLRVHRPKRQQRYRLSIGHPPLNRHTLSLHHISRSDAKEHLRRARLRCCRRCRHYQTNPQRLTCTAKKIGCPDAQDVWKLGGIPKCVCATGSGLEIGDGWIELDFVRIVHIPINRHRLSRYGISWRVSETLDHRRSGTGHEQSRAPGEKHNHHYKQRPYRDESSAYCLSHLCLVLPGGASDLHRKWIFLFAAHQTPCFRLCPKLDRPFLSFLDEHARLRWRKPQLVRLIPPFQIEFLQCIPLVLHSDHCRLARADFFRHEPRLRLVEFRHVQLNRHLRNLVWLILARHANCQRVHAGFALRNARRLNHQREVLRCAGQQTYRRGEYGHPVRRNPRHRYRKRINFHTLV